MVLDQGANSAFSLLAGLGAAWLLTATGFGLFGALFAVALIARGVVRAAVLEPLQIRSFGPDLDESARVAVTATVLLLLATTVVVAVVAAATGSPDWSVVAAFSVGTTLVGVSDAVRAVEVAAARPARGTALSAVMLVVLIGGLGVLVVADSGAVAVWLTAGTAALVGFVAVGRNMPGAAWRRPAAPDVAVRWMWRQRDLTLPLLLDFAASAGIAHAAVVVLVARNLEEAGALRAAMMAVGPLQFVFVALAQFLIVESARVSPERADRLGAVTAGVWGLLGAGYLAVVWVGADVIESLLGDSGPAARSVVPAAVLMMVAAGPGLLASSLMRTRGLAARAARIRLVLVPPLLAAVVLGAATTGATGVAWWSAAVHLAGAPVWWLGLRRG